MSKEQPEEEIILVSKSQLKREMHELQELGRKIVSLPKAQRSKLPLDESMQSALVVADKIKNKHEPFNRHIQYISKLLREADLDAIQTQLDIFANKHQQVTLQFQHLENLRDNLIAGGNQDIEDMLIQCPSMERQKLRQLVRQAAKEVKAEKPAKSYRDLFQYIKENHA